MWSEVKLWAKHLTVVQNTCMNQSLGILGPVDLHGGHLLEDSALDLCDVTCTMNTLSQGTNDVKVQHTHLIGEHLS